MAGSSGDEKVFIVVWPTLKNSDEFESLKVSVFFVNSVKESYMFQKSVPIFSGFLFVWTGWRRYRGSKDKDKVLGMTVLMRAEWMLALPSCRPISAPKQLVKESFPS